MLGNGESFASSVIASATSCVCRIFIWFRFRESGDRIPLYLIQRFELDLIYVDNHFIKISFIDK
jgi:hypothetical protein